jgi:predicted acetyltransferase
VRFVSTGRFADKSTIALFFAIFFYNIKQWNRGSVLLYVVFLAKKGIYKAKLITFIIIRIRVLEGEMELTFIDEIDFDRFCRFEKDYSENGNARYSDYTTAEAYRSFLNQLKKDATGLDLGPEREMQIAYWLRDESDELLGAIRFRPKLSDALYADGGHVGYDVRPSVRNKGIATRMLSLMIEKARRLGYERLLLMCAFDNAASGRVMAKCGGILESIVFSRSEGKFVRRFWVPTGLDLAERNGISCTTCFLKETKEEDFESLRSLWADGRVMRWVGFPRGIPYSSSEMREWLDTQKKRGNRHFSVFSSEEVFCGEVFYAPDLVHRRAGLDIKIRPEYQGKGIAVEAFRRLIDFCFKNEPLVREVWTEPSSENMAARGLYEKCGLLPKERPLDMEPGESYWTLEWERWQPQV